MSDRLTIMLYTTVAASQDDTPKVDDFPIKQREPRNDFTLFVLYT